LSDQFSYTSYAKRFWFRPLVDYRLAVVFAVASSSAALGVCAKAELQRLFIYATVSSLLAITIYLLIAALPVGFISGRLSSFPSRSGSGWISTKKRGDQEGLETFTFPARWALLLSVGCDCSATSVAVCSKPDRSSIMSLVRTALSLKVFPC